MLVDDAVRVSIGSYAQGSGNVISGNLAQGIKIQGSGTMFTSIRGNRIGTDVTGTAALGNGEQGVLSTAEGIDLGSNFDGNPIGVSPGGACTGACNLISANQGPAGVELQAQSLMRGNFVGTDITGTQALGNAVAGVIGHNTTFIGTWTPEGRNIISGNGLVGVRFTGYAEWDDGQLRRHRHHGLGGASKRRWLLIGGRCGALLFDVHHEHRQQQQLPGVERDLGQ